MTFPVHIFPLLSIHDFYYSAGATVSLSKGEKIQRLLYENTAAKYNTRQILVYLERKLKNE